MLLSINGGKCADIRMSGTDASKAVRKAAFEYGAGEKALDIK